jgi:hypothetical protein
MAKTNWDRYFEAQLQDEELRRLVEAERTALEIGHRIATLRRKRKVGQAQVAAAGRLAPRQVLLRERPARPAPARLARHLGRWTAVAGAGAPPSPWGARPT